MKRQDSHYKKNCYRYQRREQSRRYRRRMLKGVCILVILLCICALSFLQLRGERNAKVFAAPEETFAETTAKTIIPDSSVLENIIFETIDIESILAEQPPLVFVDAGHGGEDGGCSEAGVCEKDLNLSIAKIVQEKLQDKGYRVAMSRDTDLFVSKADRVSQANSLKADIFVSIHQNFSEISSVNGMEVWYDGTDETDERDSKGLARLIWQEVANSTGASQRELRADADFYVTSQTDMPACLIETGFLSNTKERKKMITAEYQGRIADGIVQGIDDFFSARDGSPEENTGR